MLKTVSHIILSLILLVSTIGMSVSKHYCKSELVSITVFDSGDPCCEDSDCCHDEEETFQLKVEYTQSITQITAGSNLFQTLIANIFLFTENIFDSTVQSVNYFSCRHVPPLIAELYSINQAYLL